MPHDSKLQALRDAVVQTGGVATTAVLVAASSRATLRTAIRQGWLTRVGRGTYALTDIAAAGSPGQSDAARSWARWTEPPTDGELKALVGRHALATAGGGALFGLSAASHHGWSLLREPDRPQVVLPQGRHVPKSLLGCDVRFLAVDDDAFGDGVTTALDTVLHCAAMLPFAEGLAVADSAVRSGAVGAASLLNAADVYLGRGQMRVRRVAGAVDGRAANPFESGLRAILLDALLVRLTVQHEISDTGFFARVDLADEALRIVFEADSYEFHASPTGFARDVDRYDDLICRDWLVLRTRLHHVLHDPGRIRAVAMATVEVRRRRGYGAGLVTTAPRAARRSGDDTAQRNSVGPGVTRRRRVS